MSQPSARTAFYEPAAFPWLAGLRERHAQIQQEAQAVLERWRYLQWNYPQLYPETNPGMVGRRATFYLEVYGMPVEVNRRFCPAACEAVAGVPGLVTSAVYLLDAHSHILPHRGATDLVLRGHMGLICPSGCWLRVGSEKRAWGEGECLVFDDTIEHEARNEGDQCRAILLFDFFPQTHAEPQRQSHLEALRASHLKPQDYPLLLAAGTRNCQSPTALPPLNRELSEIIAQNGMYLS